MPSRRRIVSRKIEPDGVDAAFALLFLCLIVGLGLVMWFELGAWLLPELLRWCACCRR